MITRYGPWALVTGASDGIGLELARQLAEQGLNLVLVARRQDQLATLAASLGKVQTRVVALDLTAAGAVEQLLRQTADLEIGLLVAAAGFGTAGEFLSNDHDTELNMIQLNCSALASLCWHYGRQMRARRRGGIILLSSILGFQGNAWSANYAATKAFVQTLAEGIGVELAPFGVDVLAAAPGPTASGFGARAGMNLGRTMTSQQVAQATLKALGRQRTVRPGWLSKLLGYSLITLPRFARTLILSNIMKGMVSPVDGNQKQAARGPA